MTLFLQAIAAVLLGVILSQILKKQGAEFGTLLAMLVCALVCIVSIQFLRPVLDFLYRLQQTTMLDQPMLQVLLKVVGVSMTAEIASLVCQDAGNAAMGKALQFLAVAVIMYLSLPMMSALINLVEEILGSI